MELNYKLIRIAYITLAVIAVLFSFIAILFVDKITETLPANTMMIISAIICFPLFILKIIYDQKYPPSRKNKIIAWFVIIIGFIIIFSI